MGKTGFLQVLEDVEHELAAEAAPPFVDDIDQGNVARDRAHHRTRDQSGGAKLWDRLAEPGGRGIGDVLLVGLIELETDDVARPLSVALKPELTQPFCPLRRVQRRHI